MIRSLFLIGILVVLMAVAFKRPEQSALEFAQEVTDKVQERMADKMPTPKETLPLPFSRSTKKVPPPADKNWRDMPKRNVVVVRQVDDQKVEPREPAKTSLPAISAPATPRPHRPSQEQNLPSPPSLERLHLPRSTASRRTDSPPMPSAPVLKVATEPLGKLGETAGVPESKTLNPTDPGMVEVRANLENAARLLAQVK
jgi:hypothetical protein